MKKIFTLVAAGLMSAGAFAQTVLWDGETAELGTMGGLWDRSNPVVVENPDKDGVNKSDKCIKITMNHWDNRQIAVPFRDWMTLDLKGNRRISLMILRSANSNVEVELSDPTDGSANYWQHAAAWYGSKGKWQKVVLDYSTNDGLNNSPGVIAITASTDEAGENEDAYIDNVVVEDVPMVNGVALSEIADGSLSGELVLTGSWMRGDCNKTDGGWTRVDYDDFAVLAKKMTTGVTSVDLNKAVLKDPYDVFKDVCPDAKVYTPVAFGEDNSNIIVTGIAGITADKVAKNNAIYTLSGVRVAEGNLAPGLYIVNGKKVMIGRNTIK